MITFGIAVIVFCVGLLIGWNIAGSLAYDEGVEDEKQHWYIHSHNWGHFAEEYMDNE